MQNITRFFAERLEAPLVNPVWSWGAIQSTKKRVFVRTRHDHVKRAGKAGAVSAVILMEGSWRDSKSVGLKERQEHIQLLTQGYRGFAVLYQGCDTDSKRQISSYENRFVYELGTITDVGGTVTANVVAEIPVEVIGDDSWSREYGEDISAELCRNASATERQAMVMARIGQGRFRDDVLELWGHRCAVTQCAVKGVLRASHIKPWRDCRPKERLDKYNGIPLVATLDALFDRHLISFTASGRMLVSSELSRGECKQLLPSSQKLQLKPHARTAKYLKEHAAKLQ